MKHFKHKLLFVILAVFSFTCQMQAQVTIGDGVAPQDYSILEVSTKKVKGGLRLPHLTTVERDVMMLTPAFQAEKTNKAKGLSIFNVTSDCVETWNGVEWLSTCGKSLILASLDCGAVAGVLVTQGAVANIAKSLPYFGKTGGVLQLSSNQVLGGDVSGLSVLADGAQNLTTVNGNINIKIAGTATTAGSINIPISLASASCNILLTSNQSVGSIGTLNCASVTGVTVMQGTAATVNKTLPYSSKTGGDISLTNNQSLGSANGLSILVDGAQNLTAANGNINIKITGTASIVGTFNIPISLGGTSCNISVTANQSVGLIGSLNCSSITGVVVTEGVTANISKTLPYSSKTGESISLTSSQVLGATVNGLRILANGAQTLSASNGNINIRIVGTPTTTGTMYIPIALAGASCDIELTSNQAPGAIGTLNCASVTTTVTQGIAVNVSKTLPYSSRTGESIVLSNTQSLGSASGLSVVVSGTQTLSATSGNINIRISGTATTNGTIFIPISIANASCDIELTSNQAVGAIGSFSCASVTGVVVTQGVAANITKTLPYSSRTGADIALSNNQSLGSASGLSVVANGAQTLSVSSGNINIKITGTASTTGTIYIPISLAGASCNISVTSNSAVGTIGTLNCASLTGVSVTQGTAANISKTLPYSSRAGANIALANSQSLGSASGLSVVVDGAQTLSTASGNINIKIIGTTSTIGAINIPISLAGANCNISVSASGAPSTLPSGTGTLSGRTCFDIAYSNDNANSCAPLSGRTAQRTDFTNTTVQDPASGNFAPYSGTQVYTFTPTGTVSKVRFDYVDASGKVIQSMTPNGNYTGNNISSPCKVTVVYKANLNVDLRGKTRAQAFNADLYAIYNSNANGMGSEMAVKLTANLADCACCGAATTEGGWLTFMCHNLGADESLDPFTPNVGLYGDLYQWGRKADGHQKRNSAVVTGPASGAQLDSDGQPTGTQRYGKFVTGGSAAQDWRDPQLNTLWGDGTQNSNQPKSVNDPCPAGWKVPSQKQWQSIYKESGYGAPNEATANSWVWIGGAGFKVGQALYLPVAGQRHYSSGAIQAIDIVGQASIGYYWSSTLNGTTAHGINFYSPTVQPHTYTQRANARSVRCVAE